MKRLFAVFALILGTAAMQDVYAMHGREPAIHWQAPIEFAVGGGHRGPWRQNESKYDYVDDPTVALDQSGTAYVAWVDQRRKDIFFQAYDPNGKPRLNVPVNVSRSPAVFSWLPRLVFSPLRPSEVFIIWQEIVFSGGSHGGEILFARSRDGGSSFSKPLNLSNSEGGDGKGRINKDVWHNGSLDLAIGRDGMLYAAWTEYDGQLWLSHSSDGGNTFVKPVLVAGGRDSNPARAPVLAVGPDNTLYLAWTVGEDNGADIRVASSTDRGRTFSRATIVAETKSYSDAPKLAVDGNGVLHLVYAESAGGPFERYHVRYTRSRDAARTFERSREISRPRVQDTDSAAFPALSLDDRGRVYVVWELFPRGRGAPRGLAFTCSRDAGQTFAPPELVPDSSDSAGGTNGSQQGLLMRKLAVNAGGTIAVVNSSFREGQGSRAWLVRGTLDAR